MDRMSELLDISPKESDIKFPETFPGTPPSSNSDKPPTVQSALVVIVTSESLKDDDGPGAPLISVQLCYKS